MNESDAIRLLLTRAIETEDRDGSLVTEAVRRSAARELGPPPPAASREAGLSRDQQVYLSTRARLVLDAAQRSHPVFRGITGGLRRRLRIGWLLAAAAFVLGAALQDLGAGRTINILAIPLLGMLVWNLAVYATLGVGRLARRGQDRSGAGLRRAVARALAPRRRNAPWAAKEDAASRALGRFALDWIALGGPLLAARAAAILHLCAALLAAGAVAGMYLRGLGFEYRAGWESTFLDARTVERVVGTVLAPASAVSGIDLPRADQWQALRLSPEQPGENAARWIHLYGVTAALFVVLPRLLLGAAAWRRARRAAADFPLPPRDDPWVRRLLAPAPGTGPTVALLAYSYHLPPGARETLRSILFDAWGEGLQIGDLQLIDYGGEDEYLERFASSAGAAADWHVLVFSLAATPEHETHGRFCDDLAQRLIGERGTNRLLVLVDESAYRFRLAGEPEAPARLEQRRRAWRQVLAGHSPVLANLAAPQELPRGIVDAALAAVERGA